MDAISCDNCNAVLRFDAPNGRDDQAGEKAGWLNVNLGEVTSWDACSRSCAAELLRDGGPVQKVGDAWLESVSEIARTIREAREQEQ